MIPLNIFYLIWTSWKPRLQSHVLYALWRDRSYPNSNFPFPGNIITTKQLNSQVKYTEPDSAVSVFEASSATL